MKFNTLRTELNRYMVGFTLIMALSYTVLLEEFYDEGLTNTAEIVVLLEARNFAIRYAKDPEVQPKKAESIQSFLGWEQVPDDYQAMFPKEKHTINDMMEYEHFPNGDDSWEGAHIFLLLPYRLEDGKILYVTVDFNADLFSEEEMSDDEIIFAWTVATLFILILLSLLLLLNRRIKRHSSALANWADQLSLDNLDEPTDFRYAEFNRVSQRLQEALQRVNALLEKEHRFLRNASHELRTPIAVTRANLEFQERCGLPEHLQESYKRIKRANHTMQQLTETLLWLNRDKERLPDPQKVDVSALLQEQCEDLNYLLSGKNVALEIKLPDIDEDVLIQETPLRIIVHNLLRNAFQHTQEGHVHIHWDGYDLSINNHDHGATQNDRNQGFGLGLNLVEQICSRLEWQFALEKQESGMRGVLTLNTRNHGGV